MRFRVSERFRKVKKIKKEQVKVGQSTPNRARKRVSEIIRHWVWASCIQKLPLLALHFNKYRRKTNYCVNAWTFTKRPIKRLTRYSSQSSVKIPTRSESSSLRKAVWRNRTSSWSRKHSPMKVTRNTLNRNTKPLRSDSASYKFNTKRRRRP